MEDQKPFKELARAHNDVKLLSRSTACLKECGECVCDVMLADQAEAVF